MMRDRSALVGVLLSVCAVGAAAAGEESEPAAAPTIEARYEALARTTAAALETHAKWCTKKRLFGKRLLPRFLLFAVPAGVWVVARGAVGAPRWPASGHPTGSRRIAPTRARPPGRRIRCPS